MAVAGAGSGSSLNFSLINRTSCMIHNSFFDIFSRVRNKLAIIQTSLTSYFRHIDKKKHYPQEPELEPAPGRKFSEPPQNRPASKPWYSYTVGGAGCIVVAADF